VAGLVGSLSALAAVGNLYVSRRNLQQQRELEEQRAQDNALPAYVDQIVQLLNDTDRPLREAKLGEEVNILARVRTLTVLSRLDGRHKGSVVQFLYTSNLIDRVNPVVSLEGADLREAELALAELIDANLYEANLSGANLSGANLYEAKLPAANLHAANLSGANLPGAQLVGADLSRSRLIQADLSGADLGAANLSGANLYKARNITNEQLNQQTSYLEGATMPNGQKYEDWLKDRELRKQNK
jgi:Pentapeptide repeats (8 copies)